MRVAVTASAHGTRQQIAAANDVVNGDMGPQRANARLPQDTEPTRLVLHCTPLVAPRCERDESKIVLQREFAIRCAKRAERGVRAATARTAIDEQPATAASAIETRDRFVCSQ
jgi:hypothetical protein